ncbi:CIA30 family protein [Occallatibacter riparius]|uniref:CIA30 family protein n=1 Tax=Occallatibacter riparius TaxID=1002689 RepID=A0A9J7BU53_9BACT|nr:CIA30 family protein [Occallatibacter riparius]UWZ84462.1 CIA30 family protein [Occallatibacter riparius]
MTLCAHKLSSRLLPALLLASSAFTSTALCQNNPADTTSTAPYKNAALPVPDRVADLLSRMTLEEKIDQINWGWLQKVDVVDPTNTYTAESARKALGAEWGGDIQLTPRNAAILRNAVQRYQLEKTRLGIPVIFPGEALHGYMEYGATSFPQALGLASTFDPALVKRIFTAIGDEAGSRGSGQVFSPVLDIARDPRWGRTEETLGEDPYLVSRMGVAAITGLQGDTYLIDRHHVLATAKHFAVHGAPEGGTNTAPGNYSERVIRDNFLVPFQAAVQEAHVGSVMACYNEIDGVPCHANHWLLDKVLRQEWGFDGYISSDDNGIQMLMDTHHTAHDMNDAARQALDAGVDFDVSDVPVYARLGDQVKAGAVSIAQVDRAVSRILATKFRLGLFDHPYVDPDYAERINNGPEHRQLALEAARKSLVLLKNDKNILPLDLAKLKAIAVIGPNAADLHIGGYSRDPGFGISVLDGIKARVGDKAKVLYEKGCKITTAPEGFRGWWADNVELVDTASQAGSIKAAVDAARKSDVAIVVVGENESTNREAWSEGHRGDRDSLDLLGAQNDLVKAVVETGKPVIVLLINGRPLSVNYIAEHAAAIFEGWYMGEMGGQAFAEAVFGDINPGGKLPITFPRTVGALPDFYNHKPSDNRSYEFSTRKPLFAFGSGLSYTTFKFDNLKVEPQQILPGATAKVTVDITNTGSREGDEVAELYLHQRVASVTQPVMKLTRFERLTLKPGEKRTVEFSVTPDMLKIWDINMHHVIEPGVFNLMVGPSSDDTKTVKLTVAGLNGETGKPISTAPIPSNSESGIVSTFDDGKVAANYGMWIAAGDSMNGGKSKSSIAIVEPGAQASKGALQIKGENIEGGPFIFSGALYTPGATPMQPVNLSSKKGISFWAKGDGGTYTVLFLTESRSGQSGEIPGMTTFVAGAEWKQYTFPFSTFETDGSDLTGIGFICITDPGKFQFAIDQVEIK